MAASAIEQGASAAGSSAVAVPVAAASPAPMDAAVAMLAEMFGVQADTAQVALHYCGGDISAAGRLLAQQARNEQSEAAQAAAAAAVAEARREEREALEAAREAAREALECQLCMDAPKTHSFMPCNHRCACRGCAELVMQRDKRCPYCQEKAESIHRIFLI